MLNIQTGLEIIIATLTIVGTAGAMFKRALKPLSGSIDKLSETLDRNEVRFRLHERDSAVIHAHFEERLKRVEDDHRERRLKK